MSFQILISEYRSDCFNSDNEAAVPRRRLSHAGLSEPRNSLGKLRMEKSKLFQNKTKT